jgi:hypothetical protein
VSEIDPTPAERSVWANVGSTAEHGTLAATLPDVEFTVLELADRLLNRGVVLVGEATISVAGVPLIYLGLNVVLSSVENLVKRGATERRF